MSVLEWETAKEDSAPHFPRKTLAGISITWLWLDVTSAIVYRCSDLLGCLKGGIWLTDSWLPTFCSCDLESGPHLVKELLLTSRTQWIDLLRQLYAQQFFCSSNNHKMFLFSKQLPPVLSLKGKPPMMVLTNQDWVEVDVVSIQRYSRVCGVAHQEEWDRNAVFRDCERPKGFCDVQMFGEEFKYNLQMKRQTYLSLSPNWN